MPVNWCHDGDDALLERILSSKLLFSDLIDRQIDR